VCIAAAISLSRAEIVASAKIIFALYPPVMVAPAKNDPFDNIGRFVELKKMLN